MQTQFLPLFPLVMIDLYVHASEWFHIPGLSLNLPYFNVNVMHGCYGYWNRYSIIHFSPPDNNFSANL